MPISMTKTNGHEEGAAVSSVTLLAFCGAVHQDERLVCSYLRRAMFLGGGYHEDGIRGFFAYLSVLSRCGVNPDISSEVLQIDEEPRLMVHPLRDI